MVSLVVRIRNLWNRKLFLSPKRAVAQEEMRHESSQVNAPPLSRRRMMPPEPLQNSYSSFEEEQGHFEVEDQIWSARDRTVTARTKRYLEVSQNIKVEIEELESLLGPDDSDVDLRRIIEEARGKKGRDMWTFSSEASDRQWRAGLEEQRVVWSSSEREVIAAMEDSGKSRGKQKALVGASRKRV